MASYRNVSIAFWTDQKIDDNFTPEDKYFYLYLLTNPHTNICGCYEISWKQLSSETGYTRETVAKLLDRMERIHHVIEFDKNTMEVLLVNWGRYNWSKSEKLKKAVADVANYVKNEGFKQYILTTLLQKTETETETDTDTDVSIGYRYPMDRVSGQKQKQKKTKFNNFEERNYDYAALEKELRNKPTG